MQGLNAARSASTLSVMVIGDSGTGKTCFVSSFPKPLVVHDFDGKMTSAANHLRRTGQGKELEGITYEDYTKLQGERDAPQDAVRVRMGTFNGWLVEQEKLVRSGKPLPFASVAVDSTTKFFELVLQDIVRATIGKVKGPIEGRNDMASLQHYGLLDIDGKAMLNRVLALPCIKVFTAHYEKDKDEYTGRVVNQAMLPGRKLGPYLPIVFEEVYRSFVEAGEFRLQTQTDQYFNCRSQLGLKPVIKSTFAELAAAINKS